MGGTRNKFQCPKGDRQKPPWSLADECVPALLPWLVTWLLNLSERWCEALTSLASATGLH